MELQLFIKQSVIVTVNTTRLHTIRLGQDRFCKLLSCWVCLVFHQMEAVGAETDRCAHFLLLTQSFFSAAEKCFSKMDLTVF